MIRRSRVGLGCRLLGIAVPVAALSGCLPSQGPAGGAPKAAPAVSAPVAEASAPAQVGTMSAAPSEPAGNNLLWNGAFETEAVRPWSLSFDSPRNGRRAADAGELCLQIDDPGPQTFAIALRQGPLEINKGHTYQLRFRTHATVPTRIGVKLAGVGATGATYWTSTVPSEPTVKTYAAAFTSAIDNDNTELVLELGGPLAGRTPLKVCLDDIELNDPQFVVPNERLHPAPRPRISVNQVGYLPGLTKGATVVSAATQPVDWELLDAHGKVVASGKTTVFGDDKSSGEHVHQIDFSSFKAPGKGYKLRVGKDESYPFEIGDDVYRKLKYDALSFFYLQRSGIPITMPYAGSKEFERPAGHPGDKSVPCAPEAKCNYSLDVSGGWYDAGDHGKYIINSGISAWTLQNQYEFLTRFGATGGDFADGKMNIPEQHNKYPDLLDEARFNLEFMLRMQVPEGQPLAGMAHQKIHGEKWSDLPTMPDKDTIKRFLRPVSTAATLDLAATAAQGARLWQKLDPTFAAKCLTAAETAWAAAKKNPKIYAEPMLQGGGAYGDGDFGDEFYWAATELFITTGKPEYKSEVEGSRFFKGTSNDATGGNMGWDHVAALAKISLLTVPNKLGDAAIAAQREGMLAAADRFLSILGKRGYPTSAGSDASYIWGSNAGVMNAGVVLGVAYGLTQGQEVRRRRGGVHGLPARAQSPFPELRRAATARTTLRNPHHRVWSHQKDPSLPEAPAGAVAGGPNSMLQDPYIRKLGHGGLPAADLLRRPHPVVFDQRGRHQLERAAGVGRGVAGRHRSSRWQVMGRMTRDDSPAANSGKSR